VLIELFNFVLSLSNIAEGSVSEELSVSGKDFFEALRLKGVRLFKLGVKRCHNDVVLPLVEHLGSDRVGKGVQDTGLSNSEYNVLGGHFADGQKPILEREIGSFGQHEGQTGQ